MIDSRINPNFGSGGKGADLVYMKRRGFSKGFDSMSVEGSKAGDEGSTKPSAGRGWASPWKAENHPTLAEMYPPIKAHRIAAPTKKR